MTATQLTAYAHLLVNYCVSLQPGERLYVSTTTLATPLLAEIQKATLLAGGHLEYDLALPQSADNLRDHASPEQYAYLGTAYRHALENFEAYINVRAPFSLRNAPPGAEQKEARRAAVAPLLKTYFERTADLRLKRSLCVFPTQALADEADMSLEEYTAFVARATKIDQADPTAAWLAVRRRQQAVVDYLNGCNEIRYVNAKTDIRFRTEGRTWINSDGRTNMPSGEVYTSPVEDSVDGHVYFDYPAVRDGKTVRGVTLHVEAGEIKHWTAEEGQDVLDETFDIPGTRRFGEAAVGTNYTIDRFTKHILFDEKIGGSIHMAIGQSYAQAGGKNQSTVHWDMIADMKDGGRILADGRQIYRDGYFIDELWR